MGVVTTSGIDEIVQDILDITVVGVSDGSFKEEVDTAFWIFEMASDTQRIMGILLIPEFKTVYNAYRREIGSIYGLVMLIEFIKDILYEK